MHLVVPGPEHLASYVDALRRGWSPDTERPEAAAEAMERVLADATGFLAEQDDPLGQGPDITLPDGSRVARLPGFHRWMWDDGGFAGGIGLRWRPGTAELPPTCLGHIGYSVVAWRRRRGYATQALREVLPMARDVGLPYVDIMTDLDNVASQRVALGCGARLVGVEELPASYGGKLMNRYRVDLVDRTPAGTNDAGEAQRT